MVGDRPRAPPRGSPPRVPVPHPASRQKSGRSAALAAVRSTRRTVALQSAANLADDLPIVVQHHREDGVIAPRILVAIIPGDLPETGKVRGFQRRTAEAQHVVARLARLDPLEMVLVQKPRDTLEHALAPSPDQRRLVAVIPL